MEFNFSYSTVDKPYCISNSCTLGIWEYDTTVHTSRRYMRTSTVTMLYYYALLIILSAKQDSSLSSCLDIRDAHIFYGVGGLADGRQPSRLAVGYVAGRS